MRKDTQTLRMPAVVRDGRVEKLKRDELQLAASNNEKRASAREFVMAIAEPLRRLEIGAGTLDRVTQELREIYHLK
jgi:hypothetical protein